MEEEEYSDYLYDNETETLNLTYLFCYFLDPPNGSTSNCDNTFKYCIQCPVNSSFHTGGTTKDPFSTGHKVSIFLWTLIVVFGLLGTLANTLIIVILNKQNSAKSFEILLSALASFDLMCSIMTVFASSGIIAYLENWNRDGFTLTWIYITYFTAVLGRTGSTFMKVLITIERYIFIAHPESSGKWLSKSKTRCMAFGILVFSVILNMPRYLSHYVLKLETEYTTIQRLYELEAEWVIVDNHAEITWLPIWKDISSHIDYWTPFPIILVFSVLIFVEIRKITCKKRAMQITRKKDIREVQMFVPVIVILFIFSILPVAQFMVVTYTGELRREVILGLLLLVAVSAAANLPIYVCGGSTFRKGTRSLLYRLTNRVTSN